MEARRQCRKSARGVALIAVLWLIALLTLLATAVATSSVSHRRAAQRKAEAVQLDALADSAIRVTVLRIIAPRSPTDAVATGTPIDVQLPTGTARVTIEREQGRIDLNTADDELLFALLAANGWDERDAQAMVDRIADWKDADDEPRANGAERSAYIAAGLRYGLRNGPFESVEELRQVKGAEDLSPELFASLTVYTHAQTPLVMFATPPVNRALEFADKRQLGDHRWLPVEATPIQNADAQNEARTMIGEVIRIHACVHRERAERCRSSVVRVTGNTFRPLQVFEFHLAVSPRD